MEINLRKKNPLSFEGIGSSSGAWTPQRLGSKVLGWFREVDEVGGQQPNKVKGANDHLTVVSGSGLNKVYTLPDTTPYKNADTDYCWWKTNGDLSTTDGNRLIAYDFAHTIVKFSGVSPYAISEIVILSDDLTSTEKISITKYMKLSPFWTNAWLEGGEVKENRAFQYVPWIAEGVATVPVLTTTAITNLLSITATSGGNISSDGNSAVTARGVCWSTSTNPTTSDSKTTNGSGTGSFSSSITGLSVSTVYHVRAYATNGIGTAYGEDIQFTTTAHLLYDTFTDTNGVRLNAHTMNSGTGWTEVNGTWVISGNKISETDSGGAVIYKAVAEAGKADIDMSIDIDIPSGSTKFLSGLLFRYSDATHYWGIYHEDDNGAVPSLMLWKMNAGAGNGTQIGGTQLLTNERSVTRTLRVLLSGNSIKIYWNGVEKFNLTDSTFNTNTKIGILKWVNTATGYPENLLDNFIAD